MATIQEKQATTRKKVTDLKKLRDRRRKEGAGGKEIAKLTTEINQRNRNLVTFRNQLAGTTRGGRQADLGGVATGGVGARAAGPQQPAAAATTPGQTPAPTGQKFQVNTGNAAIDQLVNTLFSTEGPQQGPLSDFFDQEAAKKAARETTAPQFNREFQRDLSDRDRTLGRISTDLRLGTEDRETLRRQGRENLATSLEDIGIQRSQGVRDRDVSFGQLGENRATTLGRLGEDRSTERLAQDRGFNIAQEQALDDIALAGQTFSGRRGKTLNLIEDQRGADIGGTQRRFREGSEDAQRRFQRGTQATQTEFDDLVSNLTQQEAGARRSFRRGNAASTRAFRDLRLGLNRQRGNISTAFDRRIEDRQDRRKVARLGEFQRLQGEAIGKRNRDFDRRSRNFNPFNTGGQ